MPGAQVRPDLLAGRNDVLNIGFAIFGQRGRHADDGGIQLRRTAEVRRRFEQSGVTCSGDVGGGDVADVGLPGVERRGLGGVDIQTDDFMAVARKLQRQRQADVTQTDHADDQ